MSKILKHMKGYRLWVLFIFVLFIVQAYCDLALPNYTAEILDTGIMQKGIESVYPEAVSKETLDNIFLFMDKDKAEDVKKCYTVKNNGLADVKKIPHDNSCQDKKVYVRNANNDDVLDSLEDDFSLAAASYSALSGSKSSDKDQSKMTDEQKKQAEKLMKVIKENMEQKQKKAMEDMTPEQIAAMQAQMKNGEAQKSQEQTDMITLIKEDKLDANVITDYFKDMYGNMSDMTLPQMVKAFWQNEYKSLGIDMDKLQKNYLFLQGGKMLGMAGVIMVCTIIVCYLAAKIGSGVGKNLRGQVFNRVLSFSNEEMDKFSTSSLITRSTNDIQQVQMTLTIMLRMCMYAPVLGIGGLIKVLNTNTSMVWTIGVAIAAVLVVIGILMSLAMPKFKIMQKKVDKLNLVTREILTGLPVIRAFSRESHEEERFDATNKDLTKTMLFTNRVMNFMMPAMMFIMNGVTVLIVWVASKQIDLGKLQVGSMTAFITYAMMIIMSFLMITMISVMLPRAIVAAERVDEVINTPSTINDKENADDKLTVTKGVVKFDHVDFKYGDAEEDVLADIDFTAEPGKTTAIIGSTGSGKSTLVHLIPRLYDVTNGKVTIDGVDVRDYTQKNLREAIGFVPQKNVLFSGDIKSNISFGCENADMTQIEKAAEVAQAVEFIDSKPDKYDSHIAQGGNNVSGGQKQRLSIARAIAKNAKILVFDDSFSALDFKTDVALRKSLNENAGDSTVIIVAQRIVTIQNADNIIVLDEGKIAGQGTHYELLRNCEVYEQIVRSQLSESEYNEQMTQAMQGKGEM